MILILLLCALCLALFGSAIVAIVCWARHHAHPYGPLEDITLNNANGAVLPARSMLQQDETLKTMKLRVERTLIELGLRGYSPRMAKQDDVAATVKEQASQIQKVSDQLEVSKAAPQMVANNQ
jgi:hypothetical protein